MLSKRKGKGVVKVHVGVPSQVCPDHEFLRYYSIYLRLKSLYVGGCIHNYRKRYDELSAKLNISTSTLRKAMAFLKNKKIAKTESSHLWFISSDKVSLILNGHKSQGYKIVPDENTVEKLQTLAIHENLKKQDNAIKAQFIKVELENVYGTVKNIQYKAIKKLHRALSLTPMKEIKKRIYKQPEDYKGIQAHATLSRQGIAKLLGYEHKSTGSRIVKRLVGLGFLDDVKVMHKVIISGISQVSFKRLHYEGAFYWRNGKVFKAMPHSIYVNL